MSESLSADGVFEALDSQDPATLTDALRQADSVRDALVPLLLREVGSYEPAGKDRPYFGWYLLARFREKRALEPILEFFAKYGTAAEDDSGDIVTEDLPRIIASVWDGDLKRLEEFVLDERAGEWARGAVVRSVCVAVVHGLLPYDDAEAWLGEVWDRIPRKPLEVWDALVCAAVDMRSPALLDRCDEAAQFMIGEDLDERIALAREREPRRIEPPLYGRLSIDLVDDVIEATSWWGMFREHDERADDLFPAVEPVRTGPKIGRNDPCPCGSGKKYKKCCAR